ncbi:hypothetical protein GH714_037046 [Hevea brasiliensis]|uniref:Bulb-type lectin domain-containing protein n=1 Tax=Hevea brasiliensis TaxID=3981 RepID=A0A6A6KYA8_HEVBR|nr:hypothetical protein GH714_037046 [Hevea brasiliensis]
MRRCEILSMASVSLFLLLPLFFTASAQQRQSNIRLDSSLTPTTNSSWLSPSGLYAFGFYPQGNGYGVGVFLAGIPQKTVVWTANRDDPPVNSSATLLFTSDSGLVLQEQGQTTSVISIPQSASSASLFDSGNFVLYTADRDIIWQSFEHPTDTLLPSQRLEAGSELVSAASQNDHSAGIFRLAMQDDGHLVQYPVGTPLTAEHSYWASGTNGQGNNVTLNLGHDGHLYLLNSTGVNIKNLTKGGYPTKDSIYAMRIDFDGIFRLYFYNLTHNGNWSVLWSSSIIGFVSVMQNNWTAGCERNFTAGSCKDDNRDIRIRELSNTGWEDDSYSVLSLSIKEECERACLQDCNCDTAFFNDGQCRKQRLPLRYGKRDVGLKLRFDQGWQIHIHHRQNRA